MSVASTAATVSARRVRVPLLNVGMVLFLGSELTFFAGLFAMYFTLRGRPGPWPLEGVELELLPPTVFTTLLVASSGTMHLAVEGIRRGNVTRMNRWIVATIALGLVFVGGQVREWLTADFAVSSHAYGSAFFTMTGFHALHVVAGVLLMLTVLRRSAAGAYRAEDHAGVVATGYYWHFVDVVWLAMYSTIFLVR
jgi:cytochrome c oxidase subunit III